SDRARARLRHERGGSEAGHRRDQPGRGDRQRRAAPVRPLAGPAPAAPGGQRVTGSSGVLPLNHALSSAAVSAVSAMPLLTSGPSSFGTWAKKVGAASGIMPTAMLSAMISMLWRGR